MAAPRPGNSDRGWNDPPQFDYQGSSGCMSGSPQHHKLNKRAAYPISTDTSMSPGTATLLNPTDGPPRLPCVHILPPTSTTTTPTPVPIVVHSLSPTTDPCGDSSLLPAIFSPTAATIPGTAHPVAVGTGNTGCKVKDLTCLLMELSLDTEEALLQFVKDGLISAAEIVQDSLQGRAMEDVKKKLTLMGDFWTCGKFSESVKSQLGSLVAALNKQLVEEADELHLALMINHTAEVNQWLVAVKRIIQGLRVKASKPKVIEDQCQAQSLDADPSLELQDNILLVPTSVGLDNPQLDASSDQDLIQLPSESSDTATEGSS